MIIQEYYIVVFLVKAVRSNVYISFKKVKERFLKYKYYIKNYYSKNY